MPLNAFIVRPFATKELHVSSDAVASQLKELVDRNDSFPRLVESIEQNGQGGSWKAKINFETLHELLLKPTFEQLRIKGETTSAVVVAGNIREDMFNRLVTADLVVADLSIHNPNVFYELGVRQAFRDKYTFVIRSDLSDYPFDLKTDRYFEYNLKDLADNAESVVNNLVTALRATLNSNDPDSPIFKLLPQLEAEDRARFIAVPRDFLEEVEWARHQRRDEHLGLMAVECNGFLWEVEGLRAIGRAQFECNFIAAAKSTWEQIVGRYPDDVEANSVLSTIYQRLSDIKKSEQALARVARTRSLSTDRLSQLRSLSGRNLKAAWVEQWHKRETDEWQRAALLSPLLQRACDAFEDSFKIDLNNSYAGLNALTMLVIQTELAHRFPKEWASIQRHKSDAARELAVREDRIAQIIPALELAVESDRDRLQPQGNVDPWFQLLEAAVACIVSDQPEYVARLYEEALHFAPESAEANIRASLEVYRDLHIRGREDSGLEDTRTWSGDKRKSGVGTLGCNVKRSLDICSSSAASAAAETGIKRILMFLGFRIDVEKSIAASNGKNGANGIAHPAACFPKSAVDAAKQAIANAIEEEAKHGDDIVIGIAAGANGGDLLFHEICESHGIPTKLCLALPRPQYVGMFVAPAGKEWVEKFSAVHQRLRASDRATDSLKPGVVKHIIEFTDSNELPRWLQGKPHYNVGRRNNQWMLQHALRTARELGDNAEITLLALWKKGFGELGIGGIGDVIRSAAMQGIKVDIISLPEPPDGSADQPAAMS